MTPGALSNAGWMHQKHPPAKTAVRVVAGLGLCPQLAFAGVTQPKARRTIRFILSLSCRSGRDALQDVSLLPAHLPGESRRIWEMSTFFTMIELLPELHVAR